MTAGEDFHKYSAVVIEYIQLNARSEVWLASTKSKKNVCKLAPMSTVQKGARAGRVSGGENIFNIFLPLNLRISEHVRCRRLAKNECKQSH